jgi:hypothetical protein
MAIPCPRIVGSLLLILCSGTFAQQPTLPSADAIMARVAAHQDAAEAERRHYVYVQHAKVTSRKGKTVMCEEITDSRVAPTPDGSHQELLKLEGRMLVKHKYVQYNSLAAARRDTKVENDSDSVSVTVGDDGMDRDLVESMRASLLNDKSKDGISAHLFPLTSKAQADYSFRLTGRERLNGHDVFHVVFRPKQKDEYGWKGDAFIDVVDDEPVMVTTDMARKIPFAVRTLLGTNLPGLGFTVMYAPQTVGIRFPVSFGTEFKVHVLFFFHREIMMSVQNREFQKTHVTSRIVDAGTPVDPDKP